MKKFSEWIDKHIGLVMVICAIAGLIIGFNLIFGVVDMSYYGGYLDIDMILLYLIPIAYAVLCIYLGFVGVPKAKKKQAEADRIQREKAEQRKKQEAKEWEEQKAKNFYLFCLEKDITELSVANIARLELMIEQNLVVYQQKTILLEKKEIEELFNKGKAEVDAINKEKELAELTKKEIKLARAASKYITLQGREKSIQYCKEHITYWNNRIKQLDGDYSETKAMADSLYNSSKEKESSWAIHGGIASGIAGGAAGLAVAADVERRNAEKRARNEELGNAYGALMANYTIAQMGKKRDAKEALEEWTNNLSKAQMALVAELPEQELFDKLSPEVCDLEVSPTGAVKFNVLTHGVYLDIYENVEAVIDGTIKATIWENNQLIGETYASLPEHGSGRYKVQRIETICRKTSSPVNEVSQLQVKLEPYHLWAIEAWYKS